ncbi:MAG: MmcQ/YjbR family DNA-binding protein [Ignavibacteriaceae bacterium]
MDIDRIRKYCLSKKGVTEEFPFDENTLVYKVMGKMFLLASLEKTPLTVNLKCDPALAAELREKYESVLPGYHMNKKHWNTIILDGSVRPDELFAWIDHSFELVVKGLKKSLQAKIAK